jgi:hypothetical protein
MATLLKTVFASFLLLFLLVWAKFQFEHYCAPTTSGIQGELRQPHTDILLIGSSHTRQGYDAAALERATAKQAFIIAYDGLDPVNMVPLVKMLLQDPARRPTLLVVEVNAENLERAPEIEEPRLFFDAPPAMKRVLIRDYLLTHHGVHAYLDMWTLAANRGSELLLTWPLVHRTIDSLSYHGSYSGRKVSGMSAQDFSSLRIPIDGSNANPDQAAALRQIALIAAASHVQLLFADPPMPAPSEAQPEIVALQNQLRALAAAENVPFYEGADSFPTNDPALFHDSNHLSTAGRALYTQEFAQALLGGLR